MRVFFNYFLKVFLVCAACFFLEAGGQCAVPNDPENPQNYLNQGQFSYSEGHYDEALSFYQKVLNQDAANAQALYGQALVLAKTGKWKKSLQDFQKAAVLDPSNVKIWMGLGWAQQKTGNRAGAIESFQKVFELESDPQDQTIAGKHLNQLGASIPPTSVSIQTPASVPFDGGWKPSLVLKAGGGFDDDLNNASVITRVSSIVPLDDGLADLGAQFGLSSNLTEASRFQANLNYDYKSYFTDTNFDSQDWTGKAAYERTFFPGFKGNVGIGGEIFNQPQGVDLNAVSGWLELKGQKDSTRVSADLTLRQESYSNYISGPNPSDAIPVLGDPSNTNTLVQAKVYQTLFSWLVLNAEYRYKNNNANSPGYQYSLNGVGCGAEFFLFSGPKLITALQLNYLYTNSLCPNFLSLTTNAINMTANQQDDVNLFTAQLDLPLEGPWGLNAYFRYVDDQCNFAYFTYVEHTAGFSLSYELL